MSGQVLIVGLLNSWVDIFLLASAKYFTSSPKKHSRILIGALLDGVYSGACMIPALHFLGNGFWRLVVIALTAWIAFGRNGFLGCGMLFSLLRVAMDGIAIGIGKGGAWSLLTSAFGLTLLFVLGWFKDQKSSFVPVVLRYGERSVCLTALRDTGNTLSDPVTGQSVLVVGAKAATALTGLSIEQLRDPIKSITAFPGLRLLPYHTVGQANGMLLALRFRDVSIGTWKGSCLVAFAPEGLENEEFQALTGGFGR